MRIKTNRFVGLLLALAMLLTTVLPSFAALAEGAAQVTFVSSAEAALKPGDTFTVTPTIANNPGFAGVTWKLDYDNTALELTDITADSDNVVYTLSSGFFSPNPAYGKNNLVYANSTLNMKNGALCALTFKVRENAAAGDYTVGVQQSDAAFKFVGLNSTNVDVAFTPCTVTVSGSESAYANAYLAYCKGSSDSYTFLPVGEKLYINNYARTSETQEVIAQYKIAVVNDGAIVSEMSDDKWSVEGSVFKTAAHSTSDPDGVFTVDATGKSEGATGTLTATLPDGTELKTNVQVTVTPWKLTIQGTDGLSQDQYLTSRKAAYAYVNDTFKFTYLMQTATNGKVQGTDLQLRYKSSNEKVATVAADGTVTAVGEGKAQITVSAVGYNYGVPTEIALQNTLDLYVDNGYVTNFVLVDADGTVKTQNTVSGNKTVPVLNLTAGEEVTLYVKAMPGLVDPQCAGTIASQKQFTVKTGTAALTASTNGTDGVTLKAGNVTAETTATVSSPSYYRSKVDSTQLVAEQFTLTVKIQPVKAESVSLDQSALSLKATETAQLTASVSPEAANQSVIWTSDNEDVATVSDSGLVTAVGAGTAIITATSAQDATKKATCEVTVAAEVDYSKAYLAVRLGKGTEAEPYTYQPIGDETVYMNAHNTSGGNIIWTGYAGIFAMLGDEKIEGVEWALENKTNAQIDTLNQKQYTPGVCVNARASGGKVGSNVLTATLPNGATLTANLEIVYLANKMTVTGLSGANNVSSWFTGSSNTRKDFYAGNPGDSFTVQYNLMVGSYRITNEEQLATNHVTFRSTDDAVASVDENGKVTLKTEGSATVYAVIHAKLGLQEQELLSGPIQVYSGSFATDYNWYRNGEKLARDYDVNTSNPGKYIYTKTSVEVGEAVEFTVKAIPEGAALVIESAEPKDATLVEVTKKDDVTLVIRGLKETANLTNVAIKLNRNNGDSSLNSVFGSIYLTVEKASVQSVELSQTALQLQAGASEKLTAAVKPDTVDQTVIWSSDNANVATVSEDGTVTAVGAGTAIITAAAKADETKTAACTVTVTEEPVLQGLTALLGCDETDVKVGDEVDVKLYVNSSDAQETYNAFRFGVSFSDNLEYVSASGLNTESDYNYVDVSGATVTVSGFGATKTVSGDNPLVTLRFRAKAAGEARVTLPENAAFANGKSVAVSDDLQAILVQNNEVVLNVKKTLEIPVNGGTVDGGKTVISAVEGESVNFTPDAPADGKEISEVQVDGQKVEPNADGSYTIDSPSESTQVTIVTAAKTYKVRFEGTGAADARGEAQATHGQIYSFTIAKEDGYDYAVSVSIGGKTVATTGEYQIAGADVTGDITIVINKSAQQVTMRNVTAHLNGADDKTMAQVAQNAQNYTFSNPYSQLAKPYKATVNGVETAISDDGDNSWTITGPFAGDVEIFFGGVYSVTKSEEITGEATAEYLKDYSFTVPAAYGKPTVTIGGVEYALADGTKDGDGNTTYVIPGAAITGEIAISLPEPTAQVEVSLYFKAEDASGNARNVYLVTAKPGAALSADKVYAYDGATMFWSEEYQAFAYLVSTGDALTAEEATAKVTTVDGDKTQKTVDYTGDVNLSGKVDLNDAQLVYDLYNASYCDFSVVSMEKMLRADMSKDKKIDVSDVTAIVAIVRK